MSERAAIRRVLLVGQTPPPIHGQSKAIAQLVRASFPGLTTTHLRMSFNNAMGDVGRFRVRKIWSLLTLVLRSIRELRREPAVLYYPPAPPALVPVLRDAIFLTLVRPFAHATVFHFHAGGVGRFVAQRPWLRWLTSRAYAEPDAAVTIGASCPPDAETFGAGRRFTVPYGIPPVPSAAKSNDPARLRLLFVGLHTATKGVDTLLEIADRLRKREIEFDMHLVGGWASVEERARFETRRSELDLGDCVSTRGVLDGDAKWREFADADLFVFPTRYPAETAGIVLIEAMAMGLPAVASDWPGPRDIVEDGSTGVLCPTEDAEAFASAIESLWRDRERRLTMATAARERFATRYTESQYLGAMGRVFREVAGLGTSDESM